MSGKGFTFKYGNKEVFVITEKKNKTKRLAKEILCKMQLPDTASAIDAVLYWMQKAEFYTKELKNGEFFFIHGENSTVCGSVEHDGIIIIEL
jgi:hypothetical protein